MCNVDDLADACFFLMNRQGNIDLLNIGTDTDVTIKKLAETIAEVVGFRGELVYDSSKLEVRPESCWTFRQSTRSVGWQAFL